MKNTRAILCIVAGLTFVSVSFLSGCDANPASPVGDDAGVSDVGVFTDGSDAFVTTDAFVATDALTCYSLPRLNTIEEMEADRELCPTIWSFYQDRLFDDYSGNIQGPGCIPDLGCPGVQLECPFARFGGEDACPQSNFGDCVEFLRDATNNGFGLDVVEDYLRCNCGCL